MMKLKYLFYLILASSSIAYAYIKYQSALSTTGSVCAKMKTSIEWQYCFTPGKGKNANKLIYYFHGGGGSEKSWLDPHNYPEGIREYWKSKNIDSPSVIAVSFGTMWLLANRSSNPKSGLYEVFQQEIVPFVESNLMKSKIEERIAIGESMGGFNAGTFSLRNVKLFTKIILLCPAVGMEDQAGFADLDSYIKETSADPSYAQFLFKTRDEYFSSWQEANAQSPLTLLGQLPVGANQPRFFLSCGDKDQYGFFEGAKQFVGLLQQKKMDVTWRPEIGEKHCSLDLDELNVFLNAP